eukprot:Colp12_sorted_trinity150504_noHs@33718
MAALIPPKLEEFCILAKTIKGAACADLIGRALESPDVYVFGELLEMPNVQQLSGTNHANMLELLKVFAYGTFADYQNLQAQLPALTEAQLKKIRHLTIVELASKNKAIPYKTLVEALQINNIRELEDLIIDAIYAEIIHGKLDQQKQHLVVDDAIGRDIKPNQLDEMIETLSSWSVTAAALLETLEQQITYVNSEKDNERKRLQQVEQAMEKVRARVKTAEEESDRDGAHGQYQSMEYYQEDSRHRLRRGGGAGGRQRLG